MHTLGAAVDADDNAWLTSYGGKSISKFDKAGKPLTPPEGITFDGQLGLMQGVIVTTSGDVWVVGIAKNQVLYWAVDRSAGRGPSRRQQVAAEEIMPSSATPPCSILHNCSEGSDHRLAMPVVLIAIIAAVGLAVWWFTSEGYLTWPRRAIVCGLVVVALVCGWHYLTTLDSWF